MIEKYRWRISGVSGVGAIIMAILFIIQFMKLGNSAGDEEARNQALRGFIWSGLAAAGFGAISLILGTTYIAI